MLVLNNGQKFERYRVCRTLGNGISGTSYEAEDITLQRKVTLKLVHPWSILSDSARRQFFRDMQSISLLSHPSQAAILDYGEFDGQLYVVRSFASAGSLLNETGRQLVAPPLMMDQAIAYASTVAQALSTIHRYGYAHGSLTFSNILVQQEPSTRTTGTVASFLIADVGLAQFVRRYGQPVLTRLPATAAPEQWHTQATPASDQYALGVLIYFWLCGQLPFSGSPEEIEQAKQKATFPLLASRNPQVTLEQEGIIRRALNAHPEDRYPTILAFVEALQASLNQPQTYVYQHTNQIPVTEPPRLEVPVEAALASEAESHQIEQVQINTIKDDEEQSTEPVSSTFLLDRELLDRLTQLAKAEAQNQPEQSPQMPDLPVTPRPQIEPDLPLPQPETIPSVPPVQPADPPKPQQEPVPPVPDPVTEPDIVLPPAPDIAQPLPDTTPLPPVTKPEASPKEALQSALIDQQPARLIITIPQQESETQYVLDEEETTLGRAGSSRILLDQDELTSRHHALIRRVGNTYTVIDQRSTHGIIINGQKVAPETEHILTDGDSIQIGTYRLLFRQTVPVTEPSSTY